jgi:cell division protein DivIC
MKNKETKAKTSKAEVSDSENEIKEIKPKRFRKKRYILLYLAIIGFVFYAVVTIINQNVEIASRKAELQDLQQQINVVEIQTQYLEKVQNYEGEELEEYIEKIAKENLGYVGDGERIFINVAGD